VAVLLELTSDEPPITRPHAPLPTWSALGFAGVLTKALVPDKKAVFTVLSVEVSAPRDEPDPRGKKTDAGNLPPCPSGTLVTKKKSSLHAA
jgi:hypothetical protein